MTVKTVASYTCAIFSVIVLILCLCTNYWIQYETAHTRMGKTTRYRIRAGLWEYCRNIKEHTERDYGPTKCFPVNDEKDKNLGISMAKRNAVAAMYILAMVMTLIGFIFVTVYCITDKYFFPVTRSAILFFVAAVFVIIGLSVYTNTYINKSVQFSWSYGAGWSAAAMYIISMILILADK